MYSIKSVAFIVAVLFLAACGRVNQPTASEIKSLLSASNPAIKDADLESLECDTTEVQKVTCNFTVGGDAHSYKFEKTGEGKWVLGSNN
jgi:hypothetical protein